MLPTDATTLLPKAQALMAQMQANNMELKKEIKRFKTLNAVLQQAIDSQLQRLPELQFADSTAAPDNASGSSLRCSEDQSPRVGASDCGEASAKAADAAGVGGEEGEAEDERPVDHAWQSGQQSTEAYAGVWNRQRHQQHQSQRSSAASATGRLPEQISTETRLQKTQCLIRFSERQTCHWHPENSALACAPEQNPPAKTPRQPFLNPKTLTLKTLSPEQQ